MSLYDDISKHIDKELDKKIENPVKCRLFNYSCVGESCYIINEECKDTLRLLDKGWS